MSNVIDLTAEDEAPPAAQPVVAVRGTGDSNDPLELDSDSDGEAPAPANTGETPPVAPAAARDEDVDAPIAPEPPVNAPAADDGDAPMAPEPPVAAPPADDDAPMAAAQPPADADAAPDETLDEPPAPEPKRRRVDGGAAPAPAPDESDASEASDESGSKRGDEGDGEAAPPPPDKRRDRLGDGYVYDPYGPFGGGPDPEPAADAAPAPVAATQPPAPDSDSEFEVAPAPAPAPADDPDETQMEDDDDLRRAMEASRASVQEDAQRRRRSWSTDDRTPLTVANIIPASRPPRTTRGTPSRTSRRGPGYELATGPGRSGRTARGGRSTAGSSRARRRTSQTSSVLRIKTRRSILVAASGIGPSRFPRRAAAKGAGWSCSRTGPSWAGRSAAHSTRRSTNGTRSGAAATVN